MAVAPTGAIYKAMTIDGESSRTYGVYITGSAVYNAPEREVEMISIPGRNGQLALDKGRFENIEVTYPAGIYADTEEEFAEAVSNFRNFLCSRKGYVRIEDEYNPNEYRMGIYKSGFNVEVAGHKAGEFEITFDCKPQRWLKSGEEAVTIGEWRDTETVSGDIVTVENEDGILGVKSLNVTLEPIQSGSGTPSPDNVRPISGRTEVVTQRTGVNLFDKSTATADSTWTTSGTQGYSANKTSSALIPVQPSTAYYVGFNGTANVYGVYEFDADKNYVGRTFPGAISPKAITTRADCYYVGLVMASSYVDTAFFSYPSTVTDYEPYQGETYTTDLGQTVYGGTLDVVSGELTDSMGYIASYNGETIGEPWISDRDEYVAGTIPSIGAEVVYTLATPQTYQLTPQEVELLTGTNNVWSDGGEVTLEYGQLPDLLINPTLFESSPLLEVEGYGSILMNGDEKVNIVPAVLGDVELLGNASSSTLVDNEVVIKSNYSTASLNSGDTLTYKGASIRLVYRAQDNCTFSSVSALSSTGSATAVMTYSGIGSKVLTVTLTLSNSFTWTAGTAFPQNVTMFSFTHSQKMTGSSATYEFGGGGEFVVRTAVNGSDEELTVIFAPVNRLATSVTLNRGTLGGDSTVPILGHPTYIDCDLGEAYKYEGDEIVDLNSKIDLGSDLPVLDAGANTITYDDTITDLKIIPRWWKV